VKSWDFPLPGLADQAPARQQGILSVVTNWWADAANVLRTARRRASGLNYTGIITIW
jgi:hypothetical protein